MTTNALMFSAFSHSVSLSYCVTLWVNCYNFPIGMLVATDASIPTVGQSVVMTFTRRFVTSNETIDLKMDFAEHHY